MTVKECSKCDGLVLIDDPHPCCFFCLSEKHDVPMCKFCDKMSDRGRLVRSALYSAWMLESRVVSLERCRSILVARHPEEGFGKDLANFMLEFPDGNIAPSLSQDADSACLNLLDDRWPADGINKRDSNFDKFAEKFYDLWKLKGDALLDVFEKSGDSKDPDLDQSIDAEVHSKAKMVRAAMDTIIKDSPDSAQQLPVSPPKGALKGLLASDVRSYPDLPVPPEILEYNKKVAESKPNEVIPHHLKKIYRLNSTHWAQIAPNYSVDSLLSKASNAEFKFKPVLKDSKLDSAATFVENSSFNLAHILRFSSTSCQASSHAWSVMDKLKEELDKESPGFNKVRELMDKAFSSIQLAQTASFDASQATIRQKFANVRFVRNLWMDESSFSKEVKSAAKALPIPIPSLDDQGNVTKEPLFGEGLKSMVDERYKERKHLDKVLEKPKQSFKRFSNDRSSYQNKKSKKEDYSKNDNRVIKFSGRQNRGRGGSKRGARKDWKDSSKAEDKQSKSSF